MKVYVAMVANRGDDPVPHVFSTEEAAIVCCRSASRAGAYSVWVVEAELDGSAE